MLKVFKTTTLLLLGASVWLSADKFNFADKSCPLKFWASALGCGLIGAWVVAFCLWYEE